MIQVSSVPNQYVENVWPHVEHFLKAATKTQGVYKIEDVRDMLEKEVIALWVMVDDENGQPVAAATTRIVAYPKRFALAIDWIGGKRMHEWLGDFSELMDRYAKDNGCSHIEGTGRLGWIKALMPFGYQKWYPTYRKELTDGR